MGRPRDGRPQGADDTQTPRRRAVEFAPPAAGRVALPNAGRRPTRRPRSRHRLPRCPPAARNWSRTPVPGHGRRRRSAGRAHRARAGPARRRRRSGRGSPRMSPGRSPGARRGRRGKPAIRYPDGAAGRAARRRHRRGDPRAPGRHRLRRDRLGQDHAAAEDLPRRRARRARADRPHAAAAHRRARGRRAHRAGAGRAGSAGPSATRSASPTSTRPDAYVKLMTDGILLAETQGDRGAGRLRHHHRRRGARAQPQHRLPARLPRTPAERAPRPARS